MTPQEEEIDLAIRRAQALCELGRFADAARLLSQLVASNPQSGEAWSLLAAAELGADKVQPGLKASLMAVSLMPESAFAHRLASNALRRLGRIEESLKHAIEAVRLDPNGWQGQANLARSLMQNKADLANAAVAADRAVALEPQLAETHITAGIVALAAKDREGAKACFERALEIDPQNQAAHNELARSKMSGRNFTNPSGLADAASGFATAVRVDPQAQLSRNNLDLVLRVFLSRAAYLIFVAAFLCGRLSATSSQPLARLLPVVVLAVPAFYALRFVNRLDANLKTYLFRLLRRERKISLAVGLDALAVSCLIVAALAPQSARTGLAAIAAISALIGRLILRAQVEHSHRAAHKLQAKQTLSAPTLWIIASALMIMAFFLVYATMTARANAAAAVLAVPCAIGALAIVWRIKQRQSV